MVVNHEVLNAVQVSRMKRGTGAAGTCVGAEEALAQGDVVAGVAGWHSARLLLPAVEIARLAPEHRRLLQFSVAILFQGEKRIRRSENHGGDETPPLNKCGGSALKLPEGTVTAVIPLKGCFHFVMSRLLILVLQSGRDKVLYLHLERPSLVLHENSVLLSEVFLFVFFFL